MLRVGTESSLSPSQIVEKAIEFFGPSGLGLEVKEQVDEGCVAFEGGGGYVSLTTRGVEKGTDVDIETREWEYQVKEFLRKI